MSGETGQERRVRARSGRTSLFAAAAIGLLASRAVLRLVPFRVVWKLLGESSPGSSYLRCSAIDEIENISRAIDRAAGRIRGTTCLPRALAAALLLRWTGLGYRLFIGVHKSDEGTFRAHAWIVSQGLVVTGLLPDLADFVPVPERSAANREDRRRSHPSHQNRK